LNLEPETRSCRGDDDDDDEFQEPGPTVAIPGVAQVHVPRGALGPRRLVRNGLT
jgi:hypothetical protein